jgi:hypothetical protein
MTDPLLRKYRDYPRMAHWFNPILLLKLLSNVILSSVFGQYADRRLIVAALDTVSADVHFERACAVKKYFTPDTDGSIWLDWVADLATASTAPTRLPACSHGRILQSAG